MEHNVLKNKKIAFIYPNGDFIQDLVEDVGKENEIKVLDTENNRQAVLQEKVQQEIRSLMDWADIVFFEWCSELLMYATQLPKKCKVMCRLHRSEAMSGKHTNVDWSKVDHLIFVNESLRRIVSSNTNIPDSSIIPNGVDTTKFTIPINKHTTKKIGHCGHINYIKNGVLMLHCFKKIHEYDPEYTLHVAGGFECLEMQVYLLNFCNVNNLKVEIEGWKSKEEMPEWYSDKDFLLNCSVHESFFVGGIEAMSSGVVPLIHNWYGCKNVYPPAYIYNDSDECLSILQQTEKQNRKIIQKRNRQFIISEYNIEDNTKKIKKIIKKVLEEKSQKTPIVNGYKPSPYWENRIGKLRVRQEVGGQNSRTSIRDIEKIISDLKISTPVNTIAEVGSGTGLYLDALSTVHNGGGQKIAFDITDALFPALKEEFPEWEFIKADCTNVSLQKFSIKFDLINCIDVVLHQIETSSAKQLCLNLFELLNPGGMLLVSPFYEKEWDTPKEYCMCYGKETACSWFSEASLEWVSFRGDYMAIVKKKEKFDDRQTNT